MKGEILNIQEASEWVKDNYKYEISPSNIQYLIQYGQIRKIDLGGETKVYIKDLEKYYSKKTEQESKWKSELGSDLNWDLSFDGIKEKDRTKHVHRLHPYKGKFIPQLVEYFMDDHINKFKKETYFNKGDIVLDPFCGSGTTLVQANELGINAIGIDISAFNSLISNVKISEPNILLLQSTINEITLKLESFVSNKRYKIFAEKLSEEISKFNNEHFPSHDYILSIRNKMIDEKVFSEQKEKEFLNIFHNLKKEFDVDLIQDSSGEDFLDIWYLRPTREEIDFIIDYVDNINQKEIKHVIMVILSRTIRSCRATTHADLATLIEPVTAPYYCRKHYKICRPRFSIEYWWKRYSKDTIKRISQFSQIRTDTLQYCLTGDSRTIDINEELATEYPIFADLVKENRIKGIFTSPPYIGMINYHEQHAYSYDLFGLERRDDKEIGPLFNGKGEAARNSYVEGISEVLINSKKFMDDDYDVFIVANDSNNLYPRIAKNADMKIVKKYRRPVLNRTEKDKSFYGETIFHLKNR